MISIIIPFFNSEKYISDCIKSIVNQSIEDIEVVCIDDGSTDSSLAIVEIFAEKDKRIKLYRQNNQGRSAARNLGLTKAQGEYICFVDSDDLLMDGALNLLLQKFEKEVDAVVSSIGVRHEVHFEKAQQDNLYYQVSMNGIYSITPEVLRSFHSSVCACLFKKSLIERFNIAFPVGVNYEDAFFHWAYFSNAKKVAFINKITYVYVRRQGSIMSKTFEKNECSIDHLIVVDRIFEYLQHVNKFEIFKKVFPSLLSDYFYLAFNYSPDSNKCQVIVECQRIISKYPIDISNHIFLKKIQSGEVGFLFRNHNQDSFLWAAKIADILQKAFPEGTFRRSLFLRCGKFVYRHILKY